MTTLTLYAAPISKQQLGVRTVSPQEGLLFSLEQLANSSNVPPPYVFQVYNAQGDQINVTPGRCVGPEPLTALVTTSTVAALQARVGTLETEVAQQKEQMEQQKEQIAQQQQQYDHLARRVNRIAVRARRALMDAVRTKLNGGRALTGQEKAGWNNRVQQMTDDELARSGLTRAEARLTMYGHNTAQGVGCGAAHDVSREEMADAVTCLSNGYRALFKFVHGVAAETLAFDRGD